jgi:hypothetical protein
MWTQAMSSSRNDLRPEAVHGTDPPARDANRSARERWLLLGLLLLCLCGGLGAGIAIGIGMSSRFEVARAGVARAADCEVQPEPARAPTNDSPSSASRPEPCRALTPQPPPKRRRARPKDTSVARGTRALAPDLHEALRLLRAAQQALRAADATRALSSLDEMARRTPDVLVEEREVTRTLAHCAAHDVDSARRTAATLREAGTARVYAHRLSESCVGPEPTPERLLDEMRQRARQ